MNDSTCAHLDSALLAVLCARQNPAAAENLRAAEFSVRQRRCEPIVAVTGAMAANKAAAGNGSDASIVGVQMQRLLDSIAAGGSRADERPGGRCGDECVMILACLSPPLCIGRCCSALLCSVWRRRALSTQRTSSRAQRVDRGSAHNRGGVRAGACSLIVAAC